MNNDKQIKINKIALIILVALFILIPIIIFIIYNFTVTNPLPLNTVISNFNEKLPDIPSNIVDDIEQNIYMQLYSTDQQAPTSGATIRDDSVNTFPLNDNLSSGTFIVDINELEQSFLVLYNYDTQNSESTDESNHSTLFCLSDPSKIIYPISACNDNSTIPNEDTLWLYIPSYTTTLPTNEDITFSFTSQNQIDISVNTCTPQSIQDSAIDSAKIWIKSLGFNPDQFIYEISANYNNCLIN
ncbi:hypothetical protein IJG04_02960 [Candidatus Saccharibacteria bacterium]|nr:hypothetical protein [Candidatus Saccharibacteria bacterium]